MPQSLAYNYSHIIFSTKDRYPFIDEHIQDKLFQYIGGICKHMDFKPVKVGGHIDHIHILCVLSRKVALMKLIEEVKSHSSKWVSVFIQSLIYTMEHLQQPLKLAQTAEIHSAFD
jgi:putative transposase